jgi:hypothetical protein
MVSSYLVHHGYSSTAEKFAEITGQKFSEDLTSIKTRQSKMINLELSKMRFFLKWEELVKQLNRHKGRIQVYWIQIRILCLC